MTPFKHDVLVIQNSNTAKIIGAQTSLRFAEFRRFGQYGFNRSRSFLLALLLLLGSCASRKYKQERRYERTAIF